MSDHLREAGVIVAHLSRALLDGSRDLKTVPGLVKRIITGGMWKEWADPRSGRKYGPFASFPQFVMAPAEDGGLGCSTVDQLRNLCAEDIEARDAIDQECQQEGGGDRKSDSYRITFDNVQGDPAPTGNSESAALRRLRKDRPDLHAEVLAGHMKANAAMVQAGYRPKTISVPVARPEAVARSLRKHMSADTRRALAKLLLDD